MLRRGHDDGDGAFFAEGAGSLTKILQGKEKPCFFVVPLGQKAKEHGFHRFAFFFVVFIEKEGKILMALHPQVDRAAEPFVFAMLQKGSFEAFHHQQAIQEEQENRFEQAIFGEKNAFRGQKGIGTKMMMQTFFGHHPKGRAKGRIANFLAESPQLIKQANVIFPLLK